MEREKMREEIRKTIEQFADAREKYGEPYNIYFPGAQTDLSIRIVNAILSDGAVVLTKEEYERLKALPEKVHAEMDERMKEEIAIEKRMGERKVEQARKDKVMEIYKRLCNVEYSIYDDAHGYAGALASEFEKIFNEHGMEVEE